MGRYWTGKPLISDGNMVAEGRRGSCYDRIIGKGQPITAHSEYEKCTGRMGCSQRVSLEGHFDHSKVLLLKRLCRTVPKETGDMEEHVILRN